MKLDAQQIGEDQRQQKTESKNIEDAETHTRTRSHLQKSRVDTMLREPQQPQQHTFAINVLR